ncbi:MAG: anmK [Rickettsiaceae bacterium]|jgi:anhydro-N-acetylmuramic acid kinase|nr:anmK [Rickettsiaceae bacterium]
MIKSLGLMSGTSLDGIDAAIIDTDGTSIENVGGSYSYTYEQPLREKLRGLLNGIGDKSEIERELTEKHAEVVKSLLIKANLKSSDIDVIGFHGQTILHAPEKGVTEQIGDGKLLAKLTGIKVVNDFRSNDVKNGGQGAPLVPLYHAALAANQAQPVAIVNIGGVGNVTWIGAGENNITAFDTGPGNALIDDWVLHHNGASYDKGGMLASKGKVNKDILNKLLDHPYFAKHPPKSLDRNTFVNDLVTNLLPEDGAATLSAFTIQSIVRATLHFPKVPKAWYITGGGRHNDYIMTGLRKELNVPVYKIEELGYNGDMLEAEAFAFLAVRSLKDLPLTLPSTTGVKEPLTGGVVNLTP